MVGNCMYTIEEEAYSGFQSEIPRVAVVTKLHGPRKGLLAVIPRQ
jgi:hypothetical protein